MSTTNRAQSSSTFSRSTSTAARISTHPGTSPRPDPAGDRRRGRSRHPVVIVRTNCRRSPGVREGTPVRAAQRDRQGQHRGKSVTKHFASVFREPTWWTGCVKGIDRVTLVGYMTNNCVIGFRCHRRTARPHRRDPLVPPARSASATTPAPLPKQVHQTLMAVLNSNCPVATTTPGAGQWQGAEQQPGQLGAAGRGPTEPHRQKIGENHDPTLRAVGPGQRPHRRGADGQRAFDEVISLARLADRRGFRQFWMSSTTPCRLRPPRPRS